ncbi:MAG: hypothetical protein E7037_01690 [Verrucomicrobia bacterium]|nr:hypothetical protein [Verrucomicrobiota bacterium]
MKILTIGAAEIFDAANASEELIEQRIAPYCDAPQVDGNGKRITQRFTFESAKKMADAFNGSVRRLLEKLPFAKASLPCYNGHPDHANAGTEPQDTEVYARVEKLDARADGLWATIRKFPALELLKNDLGRLEISPRWLCEPQGGDVFAPFRLISLGFVKKGNLPNADTINENLDTSIMTEEQLKRLAEALGISSEQANDPEAIITAATSLKSKAEPPQKPEPDDDKDDDKSDDKDDDKVQKPEPKANSAALQAAVDFAIAQKLDVATANGQITVAQRASYEALLKADFVNTAAVMDALPKNALPAPGKAKSAAEIDAANREQEFADRKDATKKFFDAVNAEIKKAAALGESIDTDEAMRRVKSTDDGAKLFAAANKI